MPDSTPSQSYSGEVTNAIDPTSGLNARWVAMFTRTDGIDKPPLVDFPWDFTLSLYNYDDWVAAGFLTSYSGPDTHAADEIKFSATIYEVGTNYVSWKIEIIGNNGTWFYESQDGATVNLTVQAVSMVEGTLTLERVV